MLDDSEFANPQPTKAAVAGSEMQEFSAIDGGVTAPLGFKACGVHAGLKVSKPDLALLVSEPVASVAGTFTTNQVQAAPVRLCRGRLLGQRAAAVVVNSGSANACTGEQGVADAEKMADVTAELCGLDPSHVFVCSTGTIGKLLPMAKIAAGIRQAAACLAPDGGDAAARAIMTTDTAPKEYAVELSIDDVPVRIGGMAKGAGMIDPNMATMLSFLTTDADVDADALQRCLSAAVEDSFNRITVDGDQSTNDTVLFLANGMAGNKVLGPRHPQWAVFEEAVTEVAKQLAMKIVKDGEGATKFVAVTIAGAATAEDAQRAARAVANSALVKTAWFGGDPNWGRIIAAVGYSGAEVDDRKVDISFDGVAAIRNGCQCPEVSLADLASIISRKSFSVKVELHQGAASDTVYTCDLSHEYVRINAEYMT
jgi:glutamate N-acetyltransferase / amino-acid N-acetyltransferase